MDSGHYTKCTSHLELSSSHYGGQAWVLLYKSTTITFEQTSSITIFNITETDDLLLTTHILLHHVLQASIL